MWSLKNFKFIAPNMGEASRTGINAKQRCFTPNSKPLPSPERLRAGKLNSKQTQMSKAQNSKV
jgi:hypothetical protein